MLWQDKIQVKKGNFGEDIIKNILEQKGYIVYTPKTYGKHLVDIIAVKEKVRVIMFDVKAKARMIYYNCTGINQSNFNEYKFISKMHNIDVFLVFVDEMIGKVYGNFLSKLEQPYISDLSYPNTVKAKGIILFSLDKMLNIKKLSTEEIQYLKDCSSRNYPYLKVV